MEWKVQKILSLFWLVFQFWLINSKPNEYLEEFVKGIKSNKNAYVSEEKNFYYTLTPNPKPNRHLEKEIKPNVTLN